MNIKELFEKIGETRLTEEVPKGPTLKDMNVTQETIGLIDTWAKEMTRYGILATYIPELKKVNPDLTAIAVGDLYGNELVVGDGKEVVVSMQSVIKPFLYIYALNKGIPPEDISGTEPTALPFYDDKILRPKLHLKKAEHPLNNAGAISSSIAIDDFEDFLAFMRILTRNSKLNTLKNVFESEMKTNDNNRAIANRMVAEGRFKNAKEGERALRNYTQACSIGMNARDALRACLVIASGGVGISDNKRLFDRNHAVRVMSAMNSFGMYERSGLFSLLVAGSRANTCKSGVGGIIININPGVGAFVTYSPLLDSVGNSVYGSYAMIPLNNLLAAPGAMRFDIDETLRSLDVHDKEESRVVHEKILQLVQNGENAHVYRADPKILAKLKKEYTKRKDTLDGLISKK
ncbi:MAG: glutaminase [Candidatus Aenigmarchaeota archaeon]